jgi:hypothetical protein
LSPSEKLLIFLLFVNIQSKYQEQIEPNVVSVTEERVIVFWVTGVRVIRVRVIGVQVTGVRVTEIMVSEVMVKEVMVTRLELLRSGSLRSLV